MLVLGTIALCYLYPQHSWTEYRNANELSRIYFVKALVEEHTLSIDTMIGRFGDIIDKARCNNHYCSDKPIGLALTAVPFHAAMVYVASRSGHMPALHSTRYWLTVLCVALPSVVMIAMLCRYWSTISSSVERPLFVALAYGLGSGACIYSTQFMGHQLGAVLGISHFLIGRRFSTDTPPGRVAIAGILAGFGAIVDYFSIPIHVVLTVRHAFRIRKPVQWAAFVSGVIGAFWPLAAYNQLAFGNPLSIGYGHMALPEFRDHHAIGLYGVDRPRASVLVGLLFSPRKGLFWLSPFLLLAPVGFLLMVRSVRWRGDGWTMVAATAAMILFASSIVDWSLGWTFGPRALVPLLPFLATGVMVAVEHSRGLRVWFLALSALSIAFALGATFTLPAFEFDLANPLKQQVLFLLERGLVSSNFGTEMGLAGLTSLIIPAVAVTLAVTYLLRARGDGGWYGSRVHALLAVLAAEGFLFLVLNLNLQSASRTTYFQAWVLKLVDDPSGAARMFEQSVALEKDPGRRREVAGDAYRNAALIYLTSRDLGSAARIAEAWRNVDPASTGMLELQGVLQNSSKGGGGF